MKRPRNPIEVTILANFGFPTIRWSALIEWSAEDNQWKVTEEKMDKKTR